MASEETTSASTATADSTVLEQPVDSLFSLVKSVVHVEWLSTLIVAAIALIATAVISHFVTKLIRRLLSRDAVPLPSSSIFVNIARVAVWAIGVSVVLSSCFDINVTGAIAALGVGGIAISLGFQDTLSNLIGGLQMSVMGLVEPGDRVEVSGKQGVVHDVTWRHTTIETTAGELIVVPNSVINKTAIMKLPMQNKVVVPISVVAGADELDGIAARIAAAARSAAESTGALEKDPSVLFETVTSLGFDGSVVVFMDEAADAAATKDAVVRAVAPFTRPMQAEEEHVS